MTLFQISAVAICWVANMLDGFDVLAISFTAPDIARQWNLSPATLGVVFSVGLIGMAVGATLLAPFADVIGRRRMILLSLSIVSVSMMATAFSRSVDQLLTARFITGFGFAGMIASLNTIVAEYTPDRHQNLAVTFLHVGFPIGGTIGGFLAAQLVRGAGWPAVFLVGGVLTAAVIPLVLWRLPESVEFLLVRRPANVLSRLNMILGKIGQPPLLEMPRPEAATKSKYHLTRIIAPGMRTATLTVWVAVFMAMMTLYFILYWTPQVLVNAGLSGSIGISGGALLTASGSVGMLALGYFSTKFGLVRLVAAYFSFATLAMVAFALSPNHLAPLFLFTALIGFSGVGVMGGLYATVARVYPPEIRTTGTGWAIGVGRLGAIIGPFVAGLMFELDWRRQAYYFVFAVPYFLAAIAVSRTAYLSMRTGRAERLKSRTPVVVLRARAVAHHVLRSSRSLRKTFLGSGLAGKSGKRSRRRSITS